MYGQLRRFAKLLQCFQNDHAVCETVRIVGDVKESLTEVGGAMSLTWKKQRLILRLALPLLAGVQDREVVVLHLAINDEKMYSNANQAW